MIALFTHMMGITQNRHQISRQKHILSYTSFLEIYFILKFKILGWVNMWLHEYFATLFSNMSSGLYNNNFGYPNYLADLEPEVNTVGASNNIK